jgi:hypothetical protein
MGDSEVEIELERYGECGRYATVGMKILAR